MDIHSLIRQPAFPFIPEVERNRISSAYGELFQGVVVVSGIAESIGKNWGLVVGESQQGVVEWIFFQCKTFPSFVVQSSSVALC
jgi:hypothetical protein